MPPKAAPNGTMPQETVREAAFIRPSIRDGVSCWRSVVLSDNHRPVPTPRITFEPIATQAFEVGNPDFGKEKSNGAEALGVRLKGDHYVVKLKQGGAVIVVQVDAATGAVSQ